MTTCLLPQLNLLFPFILLAAFLLCSSVTLANTCPGCLDLDEINFDKTLKRFPYALVKFDIAFPYGEKHEAFAAFSQAAHSVTDDILIGTVGIKDYGDNENKKLGERFKVDVEKFPAIFLFRTGEEEPIALPSHMDVTLDNLKAFVSSHTQLYIGCEGCLKDYNDLAKNFANLEDSQQKERLMEAKKLAEVLVKDQQKISSKIYMTFMERIMAKGYKFVEDESKRLLRLKAGKVSEAKKAELQIKLNILESFHVNKLIKDEF